MSLMKSVMIGLGLGMVVGIFVSLSIGIPGVGKSVVPLYASLGVLAGLLGHAINLLEELVSRTR